MPKQAFKLITFDGGLSEVQDPRDILDKEFSQLENLTIKEGGKLVVVGQFTDLTASPRKWRQIMPPALTPVFFNAKIVSGNTEYRANGARSFLCINSDYDGMFDPDKIVREKYDESWTNTSSQSTEQINRMYFIAMYNGFFGNNESRIIGVFDEGTNVTVEASYIPIPWLKAANMIWADGVLRIYEWEHDYASQVGQAGVDPPLPRWHGHIPGKLYGTILEQNKDTNKEDWLKQGYVYTNGGLVTGDPDQDIGARDKWYTEIAHIDPCFPIALAKSEGAKFSQASKGTGIGLPVGRNLIMGSVNCTYHTYQLENNKKYEPTNVFGFADEETGTGTGPSLEEAPGLGADGHPNKPKVVRSQMYWGHGILFKESSQDQGTWAPTGEESYQFYCSTIYDGNQESLPQLFTMYAASGAEKVTEGPYEQDTTLNSYSEAVAKASLRFGHSGEWKTPGKNISLHFNPLIKWNGRNRADGIDNDGTIPDEWNKYNFGAKYRFTDVPVLDGLPSAFIRNNGNERITGIRVYWSSDEDGFSDLWLLYEWDFEKGFRAIGSEGGSGTSYSYVDWARARPREDGTPPDEIGPTDAVAHYQHPHADVDGKYGVTFKHPPRFATYEDLNGHKMDETINIDSCKAIIIANRRAWAANVQVGSCSIHGVSNKVDCENLGGTWTTKVYGDRMIKSPVNQFDKFPFKSNSIDVTINDGEEITALSDYADRILQFKSNTLYIINISGDMEILESTHKFKGVQGGNSVCKTDFGVAWINRFGAYIYDGQKVIDLFEKDGKRLISSKTWENKFDSRPDAHIVSAEHSLFKGNKYYQHIAYDPSKKHLLIVFADRSGYILDLVKQAWTPIADIIKYYPTDGGTFDINHFNTACPLININGDKGQIAYYDKHDEKVVAFEDSAIDYINPETAKGKEILLVTKDIDFGEPGIKKNLYELKISYKGNGVDLKVQYAINGNDTFTDMHLASPLNDAGTNDWQTTRILFNNVDTNNTNKGIYSVKIKIYGATYGDFELNDLTIIYRRLGTR